MVELRAPGEHLGGDPREQVGTGLGLEGNSGKPAAQAEFPGEGERKNERREVAAVDHFPVLSGKGEKARIGGKSSVWRLGRNSWRGVEVGEGSRGGGRGAVSRVARAGAQGPAVPHRK